MEENYVIITTRRGTYRGTIISFADWGTADNPNRYIEFTHDCQSDAPKGYGYFKEDADGPATVTLHTI